MTLPDKMAISC